MNTRTNMNTKKKTDVVAAYYTEKQRVSKYKKRESFIEVSSRFACYDTYYGLSHREIELMIEWN